MEGIKLLSGASSYDVCGVQGSPDLGNDGLPL